MEYLDGRIFDDPSIPGVTAEHRAAMWKSAITTLAKLHLIPPASNELLRRFGKPNGFYNRQIKTLSAIEAAQAATKDVDTHVPVGKIPRFDEMVFPLRWRSGVCMVVLTRADAFFRRDPARRPVDCGPRRLQD